MLFIDVVSRRVRVHLLLSVGTILTAAAEIAAHAVVVLLGAEGGQLVERLRLHHEVDSLGLFVMVNKLGYNNVYEAHDVRGAST